MVNNCDQSFYSLFADMAGKGIAVSVELKNGVILQGKLAAVDKFMNFSLFDLNVDIEKWPQFVGIFHPDNSQDMFHQRLNSQVRSLAIYRSRH
jgi:small nuclear ribonucleoprotein (snRNP)-like protein